MPAVTSRPKATAAEVLIIEEPVVIDHPFTLARIGLFEVVPTRSSPLLRILMRSVAPEPVLKVRSFAVEAAIRAVSAAPVWKNM